MRGAPGPVNVPVEFTVNLATLRRGQTEGQLRTMLVAGLCLVMVACGGAEETVPARRGSSELTVTLPPTLPSEPAAKADPPPAEAAPQAGFETVAATPVPTPEQAPALDDPAEVEVALAPAADAPAASDGLPPGTGNWGAYLRKARFACARVASVQPVERPGASPGYRYYRVDCENGGSYQATDKRGHLFFRRWQG